MYTEHIHIYTQCIFVQHQSKVLTILTLLPHLHHISVAEGGGRIF